MVPLSIFIPTIMYLSHLRTFLRWQQHWVECSVKTAAVWAVGKHSSAYCLLPMQPQQGGLAAHTLFTINKGRAGLWKEVGCCMASTLPLASLQGNCGVVRPFSSTQWLGGGSSLCLLLLPLELWQQGLWPSASPTQRPSLGWG